MRWKKRILHAALDAFRTAGHFVKGHAGQIGYYACVALVLAAVAVAAERLRSGKAIEEAVLPAVEISLPVQAEEEPQFELPEGMTVLREFEDLPDWNRELGHWETHAATDYICPDGKLYSFSDGIIKTIGKSGIYGGFMEVESGEYVLRYASAEFLDGLEPGKKIAKGDLLGAVDDSMPGEAYMNAHLHLELIQNSMYLDFSKESKKSAAAD